MDVGGAGTVTADRAPNPCGTAGRDTFVAKEQSGKLRGKGYFNRAVWFDQIEVHAGRGTDVAKLRDAVLETGISEPVEVYELLGMR